MCIVCTYYAYNLFIYTYFFFFFDNSWLNYLAPNRPAYNSGPADNSGQAGQAPGRCLMAAQGQHRPIIAQGRSQHRPIIN